VVEIIIFNGVVKFVRSLNGDIKIFNCKSVQYALASKVMWESVMYS